MLKTVKKLTSGKIYETFEDRRGLKKKAPIKSLSKILKNHAGRDDLGHVSTRHQGGRSKRKFRQISTLDEFFPTDAEVMSIEYDPNRSANIALVKLKNGKKRYIIAPDKLRTSDVVKSTDSSMLKNGDRARLRNIPTGSSVHNIQMYPESKSSFAKAAGTYATLMAIENKYALLKLPSGELRRVNEECFASCGQVSNIEHGNIRIGKAGRSRRMGIRPSVRGKAMYPEAHPHGGGEGVNPIGLKYPKTPWGKNAMGKKTRRNRLTGKFIIKKGTKKR
ncbi:MAG: 50S ribosomal protein L2 [Candidatus Berkelbacteria bacterium]|nr:50S ribosomal protein L2 [Candidatus Berkelbacteria bacterium]